MRLRGRARHSQSADDVMVSQPAAQAAAAQDMPPQGGAVPPPGGQPAAKGEAAGGQAGPAGVPGAQQAAVPLRHHVVRRTRAGGAWVGLALSAVVLLLLLVFILENEQSANIGYFGAHGHLPLGVALLLAAVAGALLVIIPGSARIMQLRRTARRHRALDAKATASPQAPATAAPGPAAGQPPDHA